MLLSLCHPSSGLTLSSETNCFFLVASLTSYLDQQGPEDITGYCLGISQHSDHRTCFIIIITFVIALKQVLTDFLAFLLEFKFSSFVLSMLNSPLYLRPITDSISCMLPLSLAMHPWQCHRYIL